VSPQSAQFTLPQNYNLWGGTYIYGLYSEGVPLTHRCFVPFTLGALLSKFRMDSFARYKCQVVTVTHSNFFYFFKLKNNYRKSSIKSQGAYLFQARLKVGGIESELGLI